MLKENILLCVTFVSSFAISNTRRLETLLPALDLPYLNDKSLQFNLLFLVDDV